MTPEEFKAKREQLGYTWHGIAEQLGLGWRQIARYEAGDVPIKQVVALALKSVRPAKAKKVKQ